VTVAALLLDMLAAQRKFRVRVVIEGDIAPRLGRMTTLALGAALPLVRVLLLVTFDADLGRVFVALTGVTALAADIGVSPLQREFRGLVIELDLSPPLLVVATFALVAGLAPMRAFLLVAILAKLGRGPERLARGMTPIAARGRVPADERKIRRTVIEHLPVNPDDVCIAALVIGVAMPASVGCHFLAFAMVATTSGLICRDRLVAVETQLILRLFRQQLMAIGAIGFEFFMAFDQRARHDQPLERILRSCGVDECQQGHKCHERGQYSGSAGGHVEPGPLPVQANQ
jgi:hypothetical protein